MQVINAVKDLDVYIEQPCLTYEECLSVRNHCPLPMVLDESIDDIGTYLIGLIMLQNSVIVNRIFNCQINLLISTWSTHDSRQSLSRCFPLRDSLQHYNILTHLYLYCLYLSGVLVRLLSDKAADVINLKISKVGGLTKARAIRDLAVQAGIPMNIEDTWLVYVKPDRRY
jgi:hypothetical protein